jgi:hypothetical protein
LGQFRESLFEDSGELKEAQGVASRGRVEDDDFVGKRFDLLQNFSEGHGLVNARDLGPTSIDQFETNSFVHHTPFDMVDKRNNPR